MEVSTRAAASTSIGEVTTRNHQQGKSDDQFRVGLAHFLEPQPLSHLDVPVLSHQQMPKGEV
jgi:hypothetical protein